MCYVTTNVALVTPTNLSKSLKKQRVEYKVFWLGDVIDARETYTQLTLLVSGEQAIIGEYTIIFFWTSNVV